MENLWNGKHDRKKCKEQRKRYALLFGEKLKCEFKGNKSEFQTMIRKIESSNTRMYLFKPYAIFPRVVDLKASAFLKTLRARAHWQKIANNVRGDFQDLQTD